MAFSFRLPRLPGRHRVGVPFRRFFRTPFPIPWPVLTGAEKTALLALTLVLSSGGALRLWERSGVSIGPVDDWESLRALVIGSREHLQAAGGEGAHHENGGYACLDDAPVMRAGGTGGGGATGMATLRAAGFADGPAVAGKKAASGKSGGDKKAPARPLDLNVAGERALLALPGVGPSTAKAIVAHRAAQGHFRSVDDLLHVKGIGPKKLEALRRYVRVDAKGEVKVDVPAGHLGERPGGEPGGGHQEQGGEGGQSGQGVSGAGPDTR